VVEERDARLHRRLHDAHGLALAADRAQVVAPEPHDGDLGLRAPEDPVGDEVGMLRGGHAGPSLKSSYYRRTWYAGRDVMSPRGGLRERLARLRGSTVVHDLAELQEPLAAVGGLETELQAFGDGALAERAQALRAEARNGTPLDAIQVRAYTLVREVARRTLGLRPFDEQVLAALALHRGTVVEVQTGEGKTLAAVMPAFLNALGG